MRRVARVRAKIEGTAERPRLTVFRSNASFFAQIIDDMKGHTLASVSEKEVKEGKSAKATKTQLAEKLGQLIAEKATKLGIGAVVFDRGRYPFHGRVKSFAEAARKGGLQF